MATIYISQAIGDDARTYAQAQVITTPWKTLSKWNTAGSSGDVIQLFAETYTTTSISLGYAITASKNFTLLGIPPTYVNGKKTWTTIFDAQNNQYGIGPAAGSYPNGVIKYIHFKNYTCANGGSAYNFGICGSAGAGNYASLEVAHCHFQDWKTATQYAGGGCIGGSWGNEQEDWLIHDNYFTNITDNNKASSYGNIFNVRNMTADSVFYIYNNSIYLPETVANNVLDGIFVMIASAASTFRWKNNVIYSATSFPFYRAGVGPTGTGSGNVHYNITGTPAGVTALTTDPLYVDPSNQVYRLRNNSYDVVSPAIDIGTTSLP